MLHSGFQAWQESAARHSGLMLNLALFAECSTVKHRAVDQKVARLVLSRIRSRVPLSMLTIRTADVAG